MSTASTAPDGGPGRRPPDALLTELSGQIRTISTGQANLRKDLGELSTEVAQLLPRVDDQDSRAAEHGTALERLNELVQQLLPDPPPKHPQVHWPSLTAADAANEWDALAAWLDWDLVPYYGITRGQLPDCWPLHLRARVELSAARVDYARAYLPSAPATAALEFNTRWLDAVLANIATAIPERLCGPGRHNQYQPEADRTGPATMPPPAGTVPPGQQPPPWAAAAPQQPDQGSGRLQAERDMLATSQHWGAAWQQAKTDDVAWRQQRPTPATDQEP